MYKRSSFILFPPCQRSVQIIPSPSVTCVCQWTFRFQRWIFAPPIKKCYELYFGCKLGDKDKFWAPYICRVTCVRLLTACINSSRQMPFAIPMVWKEPKDHPSDCYDSYNIQIQTHSKISRFALWKGSDPHSEKLLVPKSRKNLTFAMTTLILKKITDSKKAQCWLWSDMWNKVFLIWTWSKEFLIWTWSKVFLIWTWSNMFLIWAWSKMFLIWTWSKVFPYLNLKQGVPYLKLEQGVPLSELHLLRRS